VTLEIEEDEKKMSQPLKHMKFKLDKRRLGDIERPNPSAHNTHRAKQKDKLLTYIEEDRKPKRNEKSFK
jgi:hypothetical protein